MLEGTEICRKDQELSADVLSLEDIYHTQVKMEINLWVFGSGA